MTVIASPKIPRTSSPRVLAAAAVAALGSAAFISSQFFLAGLSDREAIASTFLVVVNAVVALAFVALALELPTVASLSALPRWAVVVTALGFAFLGALAWGLGTVGGAAAGSMTDAQFENADGDARFTLAFLPKMLLGAVGLLALALAGWRRGAVAKGACVVLALAGLASVLPPYPPGALLAAIGLVWAVRSATPTSELPLR